MAVAEAHVRGPAASSADGDPWTPRRSSWHRGPAVTLSWIEENPARWDADKARIVGAAAPGSLPRRYGELADGDLVPGDWWRVERDGAVEGYGWLERGWGDGEMLVATAPEARGRGVGSFALDHLVAEARRRGLNYLHNVVPLGHPQREAVERWLLGRGFRPDAEGRLFRGVTTAPADDARTV